MHKSMEDALMMIRTSIVVFNEYFSTIASETASTIPDTPTHFSNFLPPKDNPQTMFIKPIKPFEMLEIVHNLDANKNSRL